MSACGSTQAAVCNCTVRKCTVRSTETPASPVAMVCDIASTRGRDASAHWMAGHRHRRVASGGRRGRGRAQACGGTLVRIYCATVQVDYNLRALHRHLTRCLSAAYLCSAHCSHWHTGAKVKAEETRTQSSSALRLHLLLRVAGIRTATCTR